MWFIAVFTAPDLMHALLLAVFQEETIIDVLLSVYRMDNVHC